MGAQPHGAIGRRQQMGISVQRVARDRQIGRSGREHRCHARGIAALHAMARQGRYALLGFARRLLKRLDLAGNRLRDHMGFFHRFVGTIGVVPTCPIPGIPADVAHKHQVFAEAHDQSFGVAKIIEREKCQHPIGVFAFRHFAGQQGFDADCAFFLPFVGRMGVSSSSP
jgi:hypothetical protein